MNERIISCSDMILKAANISTSPANELPDVWKNTVSKIKTSRDEDKLRRMPIGERLAGNTRVIDLKNGILLIETDHSGWIQYLKMYQKFIITGINRALPDLKITNFAFRIAGSNVNLSNNYNDLVKKEKEKFEQKTLENDKILNANIQKKDEDSSKSLPPELLGKFENMRRSLLTENNNK